MHRVAGPGLVCALLSHAGRVVASVLLAAALLLPQGVVNTRRAARPSQQARTDQPLPEIHFEDVAARAGLRFQHVSGDHPQQKNYIVETTGSGVAIFDYDNDGWYDIFLVNGTKWQLDPDESGPTSRLFRNRGIQDPNDPSSLHFEDVTGKAGLVRTGWGQGVCVGDYDNDGFDDLFVTYWRGNVLYRNLGDGRFRNVTASAGIPADADTWGTGCAFFDYDRDGHLDLAVADYMRFDPTRVARPGENQFCMYKGMAVMCGPRGLPGGTNFLYRNEGNGKYTDVSEKSGFNKPSGHYSFAVLTADYDNDGWTDVYVACDSTPSILQRNNGDGTFTDIGLISGTALNEDGHEQAGMGAAAADYNNDGRLDIAKTNFSDDTPNLYRNEGDGMFTDATYRSGLGVNNQFLGWGVGFVDVDQDGWKDVLMVNGHVYPEIDKLQLGSPYHQERNVYWNLRNGAFLDISHHAGPGIVARKSGRGAAFGDLNNDGSVEVVINNMDGTPSLLVSRGDKNNWLRLKTRGTTSNRNGIGARVTVVAGELRQTDEVRSGGSYLSHNDLRLHFGIGDEARVDEIHARWPSGAEEMFPGSEANREVLLVEGKGRSLNQSTQPESDAGRTGTR